MTFPFINGTAKKPPEKPVDLPVADPDSSRDPATYLADPSLVDAVNVALLLSQPLLLTGEPGTGKTELAFRLAWELGLGKPLVFNTKSTSIGRDLFYTFDTMSRFQVAHTGEGSKNNLDYVTYNALGIAILRSREYRDVEKILGKLTHDGPRRSVVLVDEIDKAPRDFPNDLLYEVENLSFRISELDNVEVRANPALRPILVLTSNSEKNLPDAFLRRCVFYNIPFPNTDRLLQILSARLAALRSRATPKGGIPLLPNPPAPSADTPPLLNTAVALFEEIRGSGLRKPPSTAELLNWVQALLARGAQMNEPVTNIANNVVSTACVLAKTRDDADALDRFLKRKFNL